MRLVIQVHAHDSIRPERYLIHALTDHWRARGLTVDVHRGVGAPIVADGAILHVDRTRVAARYLRAVAACPAILNRAVLDIGKDRVSMLRVRRGDGHRGPVIVKSVLNHGGVPEFDGWRDSRWTRPLTALRHLPWSLSGLFVPKLRGYPVFDSPARVPPWVWWHPGLIVERLAIEREGDNHVVRHWTFLGDRDLHYRDLRRGPVPARGNTIARAIAGSPPDELRALRRRLGFDYGKFDYAVVDGRAVVYDCNRTPGAAAGRRPDFAGAIAALSLGLEAAVADARARSAA